MDADGAELDAFALERVQEARDVARVAHAIGEVAARRVPVTSQIQEHHTIARALKPACGGQHRVLVDASRSGIPLRHLNLPPTAVRDCPGDGQSVHIR